MANIFKDISQFTLKSAATGTEEFQVSATEKVTAQQVANIVQLSQVLMSGFSALSFTGIEKVKDNNSLLGSIAILYDLVAKGNIKLVSNGSTEYGFVSMGNVNGTNHGFGWLLSISEKAIYINNDFTSPNPSTLNNIQWVNTIKAGEKVSLDSGGIQTVTVTNFQTNVWNNDANTNVFSSVPVGGMVVFLSAADATSGPGEALMGYAIKVSSIIASYVGMTTTNGANVTPTLYTHKSSSLYATKWQKLPDSDNIIVIPEGTPVNDMDYYPIPRDQGTIIPIVIKAGAESAPPGGYEYVGTVQYIYGGNNPEMMINVCAAESDMIARNEWYQAHIDTEGISAWVKMGGSSNSGVEKLSNWSDQGIETAKLVNIGLGEVTIPLNRALKETDILRIDFIVQDYNMHYLCGNTIIHVTAAHNLMMGQYEIVVDEKYINWGDGEFAKLSISNSVAQLIGKNVINMYINTNGSVPQDNYYIMGIYNISGQ